MSYRSNYMLRSLCALGLIGSVAGCSSDPTLYTVAAVAGDARAGGPAVVEIRTPVVSPDWTGIQSWKQIVGII